MVINEGIGMRDIGNMRSMHASMAGISLKVRNLASSSFTTSIRCVSYWLA